MQVHRILLIGFRGSVSMLSRNGIVNNKWPKWEGRALIPYDADVLEANFNASDIELIQSAFQFLSQ